MATLSIDKTVFLFPHCMWGLGEGVGLVKNPKTISDHFSVWNNFDFFIWPFFLVPNCVKGRGWVGSKNVKVISDQFSSHFGQFGTNLIFFVNIFSSQIRGGFSQFGATLIYFPYFFVPNLGVGRGGGGGYPKIRKLFLTNFFAISGILGHLFFF